MPLIKSTSKQAFGKNVAAEIKAGRPLKQSLAIAYSEKREAEHPHHSSHTSEMASAYEHSVAHTKQDFHTGVKSSRMKSTKE